MYNDLKKVINMKIDVVNTILLNWKDSIEISEENKEKLLQCIFIMLDIENKDKKVLKLPTTELVNKATKKDYNSIYTLYMKTCDEVFKFISMLLNEDRTVVALSFVETYVYGFIKLNTYDFSEPLERWLKGIALVVVEDIKKDG